MGNACTNTKKRDIIVPSRIIEINKKKNSIRSPGVRKTSNSLSSTLNKNNSPVRPNSKEKTQQQYSPDFIDDAMRSTWTLRSPQYKIDVKDLGIGQFFLEAEFQEITDKFSELDKKKALANNVKWDVILVNQRKKVSHPSQDDSLYNHTDLCLAEFAAVNPKKYQKMLKKGIPARYRWSVWKNHVEIDKFYERGLYERLKGLTSRWETDIIKDLHRTFPFEPYFYSNKYEQVGQKHLFNVLKAISLYLPTVGYAQSMNFLVAFLLIVNGGNELEAFWTFISLARDHRFLVLGLFEKGFPLLEFYTFIFYELLQAENPLLHDHIKQQQIPDLLWLFKWILTIFLYSFPQKHVVRIWDFIMVRGLFSVIQVAISIVKFLEKDMLNLDTFGIDQLFRHLKGEVQKPKSQSLQDHTPATSKSHRPINKKGTVIVNHTPSNSNVDNKSITNQQMDTSEMKYEFKEFDIEHILEYAEKVPLGLEKISHFASIYTSKTEKKLPDLYEKFFTQWHFIHDNSDKLAEFQNDLDYSFMKSELHINPSSALAPTLATSDRLLKTPRDVIVDMSGTVDEDTSVLKIINLI